MNFLANPTALVEQNRGKIDAIKARDDMSARQKRKAIHTVMGVSLRDIQKQKATVESNLARRQAELVAFEQFASWARRETVLQSATSSRVHHFLEAGDAGGAAYFPENLDARASEIRQRAEAPVFVIRHNWAAAFSNATDFDGEFALPYEDCVFEMQISGKRVIVLATGTDKADWLFLLDSGPAWLCIGPEHFPADFCFNQIRALSIALDAEVAEATIERAPHKLNKAREKDGKILLRDFHLVSLARRHRLKTDYPSEVSGTRKRLHFRRGHWRHFATFKTWVRWTLVGDPALGFIDKDYIA